MTKRGRVVRVPGKGPGVLMLEGQQFSFSRDSRWRSAAPPTRGLVVEVDLDGDSQLTAIYAVAGGQLQPGRHALNHRRPGTIQIIADGINRVGRTNLVAVLVLMAAWCLLTNVSLQPPLVGNLDFTFWQVLGLLNERNTIHLVDLRNGLYSVGCYGWLAVLALTGPFLSHFWKDKLAVLGGMAPLFFTIIIWMLARNMVQNALATELRGTYAGAGHNVQWDALNVVSLKLGAYLSVIVALYFTYVATKKYFFRRIAAADNSPERDRVRAVPRS